MIGPQSLAQPIGESIKLHPPTERAEGRRTSVWTLAAPTNRMARRTHSLRKSATLLLQCRSFAVLGEPGRCREQQKGDDKPQNHSEKLSCWYASTGAKHCGYLNLGDRRNLVLSRYHPVVNHWFGLELVDGGARLMTVLQLRQENVSKCALFSSDLLLNIARPQSGQCRSGGRVGAAI
jgi:hypothetical protein